MSFWIDRENYCKRIAAAMRALGLSAPELDSTSETDAYRMIAEALEAEVAKRAPGTLRVRIGTEAEHMEADRKRLRQWLQELPK